MKVALVCSHGGHLTELQLLSNAFEGHETFYVTYDSFRTRELEERAYLLENIGTSPWRMLVAFVAMARILWSERPDAIVSTGSEIAIPAFVIGTLLGAETVFIESWCRVTSRSGTGRILYYVADLFLVQWPELQEQYGQKARYHGSVL